MGSQRNQEERAQDMDQETCVAELTREVNDVEKRKKMNAKFRAKYIWRFTLCSWTQTPETWLSSYSQVLGQVMSPPQASVNL